MANPIVPAPATPKVAVKTPKHSIKPITGGVTYTATSFDVAMMVDSAGTVGQMQVRFYDANGKLLPVGVIKPVAVPTSMAAQADLQAIAKTPAQAGETLSQLLLRASTTYVQHMYGATIVPG